MSILLTITNTIRNIPARVQMVTITTKFLWMSVKNLSKTLSKLIVLGATNISAVKDPKKLLLKRTRSAVLLLSTCKESPYHIYHTL